MVISYGVRGASSKPIAGTGLPSQHDKQRPLTHFLDLVFFFEVLFFFFFERVAVRFAFLIGK